MPSVFCTNRTAVSEFIKLSLYFWLSIVPILGLTVYCFTEAVGYNLLLAPTIPLLSMPEEEYILSQLRFVLSECLLLFIICIQQQLLKSHRLISLHRVNDRQCMICACYRLARWRAARQKHSSSTSIEVFTRLACRSLVIQKYRSKVSELDSLVVHADCDKHIFLLCVSRLFVYWSLWILQITRSWTTLCLNILMKYFVSVYIKEYGRYVWKN